jgi:hypothetical protein
LKEIQTHAQVELIPDLSEWVLISQRERSGIRTGTVSVTITACGRTLPGADPWSIKLEVNPGNYDDGPGISEHRIL